MLHIYLHLQRAVRILSIPLCVAFLSGCASFGTTGGANNAAEVLSSQSFLSVAAYVTHTICLDSPAPLQSIGLANSVRGAAAAAAMHLQMFYMNRDKCFNNVPIDLVMGQRHGAWPGKRVRWKSCWDVAVYRALPTRNPGYGRKIFAMVRTKCGRNV